MVILRYWVQVTGIILCVFSCIPPRIYNKKDLIKKNEIGIYNSNFRTDGYYYIEKQAKYNLVYIDTTTTKENFIQYLIFDKEGYVINLYTVSKLDSLKSFTYLHNQIQNKIKNENEGRYTKKETFFFNKNAMVWDTGVYRINGNDIKIQMYGNKSGDYVINELNGRIDDNNTLHLLLPKSVKKDTIEFKFMPAKVGQINSYIKENPNKFWK